jgi:hypothetical protein
METLHGRVDDPASTSVVFIDDELPQIFVDSLRARTSRLDVRKETVGHVFTVSEAGILTWQRVDDISSNVYPQFVKSVRVTVTPLYQLLVASVRPFPLSAGFVEPQFCRDKSVTGSDLLEHGVKTFRTVF